MDMQNVRFLWASDEINAHAEEYWSLVMDVARVNNLARIQRCCTIMGRKDTEEMSAAQIFYPCMQCADVFFLKVRLIILKDNIFNCAFPSLVAVWRSFLFSTSNAALICFFFFHCAFQQADICQLGMDQRKVNMLARYKYINF